MARKPGTPAGEVGREAKPCGWSMDLERQYIGRGSATVTPLVGSEIKARFEALKEAYEDAAAQAYDYVVAQYKALKCTSPCRKTWKILGILQQLLGGFSIQAMNVSESGSLPGVKRFRASITLKCAFRFECAHREAEREAPDPDELLAAVRAICRLIDLLIDYDVLRDP